MKKLIILLMAFCLAMPAMYAEISKKEQKTIEKMAKDKAKELTKSGYQAMGSLPLQAALERHYKNILIDGMRDEQGISTATKSKNNGRMMAQSNAMNAYAGKWASQLKQRVIGDAAIAPEDQAEFENLYSAFERLVEAEIKGELQESFSVIKTNPDGTYEIQIYYLVDEEKASKARVNALKNAAKESDVAQKYADQLSKFVNEGFE